MNVGLITYHAAYNYGSVLQAFATQTILERLGCSCSVLNYRFKGQKDFYTLVRKKYGAKILLMDLIQFPAFSDKRKRANKFEGFISEKLNLTQLMEKPEDLKAIASSFDVFVSGGDQIWSKYSSELYHEDWKWMMPYLLTFTDNKKISYASSIGSMTTDDLSKIEEPLRKYSHIAVRERSAADTLTSVLGKDVEAVIDPTLLLEAQDYFSAMNIPNYEKQYIFYYTLRGYKEVYKQRNELLALSKKYGMPIYALTPFCHFPNSKNYKNVISSGVEEFLGYINSAQMIITDSFHGSAFSVIFKKKFYSICKGWDTDYRKSELLRNLGLQKRVTSNISLCDLNYESDYTTVGQALNTLRNNSIAYLRDSLEI